MILLKYMKRNSKKIYNVDFYHLDVALTFIEKLCKTYDIKCFSLSYLEGEDLK